MQRGDRRSFTSNRAMPDSRENQLKSEPSLGETKETTDGGEHRATQKHSHAFQLYFKPVSLPKKRKNTFMYTINDKRFTIFELSIQLLVKRTPHPLQSHFNLSRCQSSRGGQSSLPYLAIIKCFGTMWGIYKRWSKLFSLSPRSIGNTGYSFIRQRLNVSAGIHQEVPVGH